MSTTEEVVPMEEEKSVMLVAIDDSEHSYYALEWTLENFFSSPETSLFKLVVLHVLPPPITTLAYAGPGPVVTANMQQGEARKTGEKVMEKAKEICQAKSINNVIGEVIEGDARNALCEAVEKHHASVLVVGSHGYGAIKRAVLGSVSDYCAHHAHCSVMIVKKPKHKSTNNN